LSSRSFPLFVLSAPACRCYVFVSHSDFIFEAAVALSVYWLGYWTGRFGVRIPVLRPI